MGRDAIPSCCRFAAFSTDLGWCAIAWSKDGVVAIKLPEDTEEQAIERLLADAPFASPGRPTALIGQVIAAFRRHLAGAPQDYGFVPLDLRGIRGFRRQVFEAARQLPLGGTVSYGELGTLAGSPRAARAVGQAMARNRFPLVIPCHRVVASNGLGGFSGSGGLKLKKLLLAFEQSGAVAE
ncbi:MAG: methylated-DNA--[protein]-cysteine S-methyltransferase [Pseudomonadota bacterium]